MTADNGTRHMTSFYKETLLSHSSQWIKPGWICALNRWSVQECAHFSFCPIACQVLLNLAWELCRQIAALILSRLTPFLWGWVVILGRRPKIYTWLSEVFYHASWWQAPLCVRCLMSNTSTVILVVGSSKQSNWAAPACCYQAWLTSIPPPLQMHNSLYRR